jgi:phosphoribosyl-AMP cyclohydrolase
MIMEHPLITDADNLNIEQLQTRISDLQKKLMWAQRHNRNLAAQIGMALETYNNKYQQRQREIWEKQNQSGTDYSDRIDIS